MATGHYNCSACGCTVKVSCYGKNRRDTDRYCEWLESEERLCGDCQEKERQSQNIEAAEQNAASGLPSLAGSDKQIAWAETIRANKMEQLRKAIAGELDSIYFEMYYGSSAIFSREKALPVDDPNFSHATALLSGHTSARWWIDSRDQKIGFLLAELLIANPPKQPEPEELAEVRRDVEAEATIRPEKPLTETVAEIRMLDTVIEISFSEKREDFWQIVKKGLGYEWSGSCWRRKLDVITNGTPADRAAEAGNRLLAAGFIIRIFDEVVRAAAIAATFPPECTRWIYGRKPGRKFEGWLVINWPDRDERLYSAARKLPGSKYDKPSIVVPAEHYEEVIGFAGLYGFKFTPSAETLIEQAKDARAAAMVARPAAPPPIIQPDASRPDLDPSTAGDIHADLLDD